VQTVSDAPHRLCAQVAPSWRVAIDWLSCLADEVPFPGESRPPGFLGQAERQTLDRLRFAKRRREWLLGRWAAKRLLRTAFPACRGVPLAAIEIDNDPDGAPFATLKGQRIPVCLSISHRDERAFCALSADGRVGADIERIEPRVPVFVRDYFTPVEVAQVADCSPERRDLAISAIWSAKEAVLKALRHGLRVDTRRVEIRGVTPATSLPAAGAEWRALTVQCALPGTPFAAAWWAVRGAYVYTLAWAAPGA